MKIRHSIILLLVTLFSCSYNDRQKSILDKVAKNKDEIYSNSFEIKLRDEFSISEIIKLTDDKNPQTRIYFYDYLTKKHPNTCFGICLKHLNDSTRISAFTSYDTQEDISIANLMIRNARNKEIFSSQENQTLDSIIVTNIKKYKHLEGQFYYYLYKNYKAPKSEFYLIIKNLVIKNSKNTLLPQIGLIDYFSSYKIKADDEIIKNYLINSIKKDKTIYFNATLEFIKDNPKPEYFDILTNFYADNIKNKTTRCDECYFELGLFCKALIKFKNNETKSILLDLIQNENYTTMCNYSAKYEQFYNLLTHSDKEYYRQLIENLEYKIDNKILKEVKHYNK